MTVPLCNYIATSHPSSQSPRSRVRMSPQTDRATNGTPTCYDQPPIPQTRVWLLLSGGLDSTACLAFYRRGAFRIACIHVDYGQRSANAETISARRVANHYRVPVTFLRCESSALFDDGAILGRNAFLLLTAILHIQNHSGILALGIHSGTQYYDCSSPFVSSMQTLLDGYYDGRMQMAAPFLDWPKHEVYRFSQSNNVPIHLTYSCERGTLPPCEECPSCLDRRSLLAM